MELILVITMQDSFGSGSNSVCSMTSACVRLPVRACVCACASFLYLARQLESCPCCHFAIQQVVAMRMRRVSMLLLHSCTICRMN